MFAFMPFSPTVPGLSVLPAFAPAAARPRGTPFRGLALFPGPGPAYS